MDAPETPRPIPEDSTDYPTPRQRRVLWSALTAVAALSLLGVAALTFYGFITFLSWSYPILLPIGLAVIVALVLDPIVSFLQTRGLKRETATLTVCLLAAIGFLLFWAYLLPPLVSQTGDFFKNLPNMLSTGVSKLDASLTPAPKITPTETPTPLEPSPPSATTLTNQLTLAVPPATPSTESDLLPPTETNHYTQGREEIQEWLKANLPAIMETIQKNIVNVLYSSLGPVGQAFGFLLGFGFVPIYVYSFLADQDQIAKNWHELIPMRRSVVRDEVVSVLT